MLCRHMRSLRTIFDPAAAAQVRGSGGNNRNNKRGGGGGGGGGGGPSRRIVGLDTLNKADHSKSQLMFCDDCSSSWGSVSNLHYCLSTQAQAISMVDFIPFLRACAVAMALGRTWLMQARALAGKTTTGMLALRVPTYGVAAAHTAALSAYLSVCCCRCAVRRGRMRTLRALW